MDATMIGPYRLERLLGFGGMGEVHLAYDTRRDRMVALKLLSEALSRDTEYQERFRRESHVAARLRDPHVVPIHDFGEVDGHLFLDMRLVEGRNIRQILEADGPLPPTSAVHLVGQVAEALEAAHADGLVHRDVKPSNVLVTATDFVYVVDFGIARSIGSARSSLTLTGVTVGTLDYMAPERFSGQAVDGRTDVYSLACLLHECLTGVPPFAGDDLPALMYAHLFADPPRASEQIAGLPAGLDAVIATGCAKQIEDRYPGPLAMVQAARAVLAGGTAPPVTGRTPAPSGPAATPTSASCAGSSAGSDATSSPASTAGSTPGSGAASPAPLTVVPGAGPGVGVPTPAAASPDDVPTRVSGPSVPGRPVPGGRAAAGEP
ncbi:MAG: protein kinase, partial [Pseudonocardiales bacterium]|nr:protein kinase [Pseudonocardiales bacterium]